MAVTHVAMFRWRPGVDVREQAARLGASLEELRHQVPGLLSLDYGVDLEVWPRTFDFALVATFSDVAALHAYGTNSAHQAVFEAHVRPVLETLGSVQFRFDQGQG
jgi:quinol monooxygenase YgiN